MGKLKIVVILLFGLLLSCEQDRSTKSGAKDSLKIDSVAVTQAVLSMHDAAMTRDLSDSLIFNQWTDFFTSDFLYGESDGKPAIQMGKDDFRRIREAFKSIRISYDDILIDHVEASGDLAYVSYHYRATVTTIKTDETQDIARSALVILRKNKAAEWKIAYQSFK